MLLNQYRTLGRSGLKVSKLCLGTMTFGEDWGWGSSKETAAKIFDMYVEEGGNFIDTADGYVNGKSEEIVGEFIKERSLRDRIVLATKFSFCAEQGNPNAGGNGRKNIIRALEGSLKRLQTDYIDLYWMHAWDRNTPVEEVLMTLNDLVRQGKIRYFGLSDVPAWYLSKMQTIAGLTGSHRLSAVQLEYSLVERSIEYEFIDAAAELGIGICPWSPLGSGLLTGKYKREALKDGRLAQVKDADNDSFAKLFTDKNWNIVDTVSVIAKETGYSAAQVALNWVAHQPGITSTIIGATKTNQLSDNLKSLSFNLSTEQMKRLDEVSSPPAIHPYVFFQQKMQSLINGGVEINVESEEKGNASVGETAMISR